MNLTEAVERKLGAHGFTTKFLPQGKIAVHFVNGCQYYPEEIPIVVRDVTSDSDAVDQMVKIIMELNHKVRREGLGRNTYITLRDIEKAESMPGKTITYTSVSLIAV